MSLPQNYTLPETPKEFDGYMNKFEEGENRIRVLSDIQTGFEWWIDADGRNTGSRKLVKGDKPVRVKTFKEATSNRESGDFKHFWVMIVWNYAKSKVQILEIKQSGIQKGISGYEKDADWGDCKQYDLVIKREGKGFETTKYQVIAKPAKPVTKDISDAYLSTSIYLDAWFRGENPFMKKEEKVVNTPLLDETSVELDEESSSEDISDQIPF